MDNLEIENDISVKCLLVAGFPSGIQAAFDQLANATNEIADKEFYGISWLGKDNKSVTYYAGVAAEAALDVKYEKLIIPKGNYRSITIAKWNGDPAPIRNAFMTLCKENPSQQRPCIEWYKNDGDVVCMVRA